MSFLEAVEPSRESEVTLVARDARSLNVLTVDVEEWFQVSNFSPCIRRDDWDNYPTRTQDILPRLLNILAEYDARATFFTLGWVAKRFPELIRRIVDEGHELASHGDEHELVTNQTPEEFRRQLERSVDTLQQAAGCRVYGHRAPSYSFRKETEWAVHILIEAGFLYDSSIFPFGGRRVPEICEERFPCYLHNGYDQSLTEYPLSTVRFLGTNWPIAGGGYFRLLPYEFLKWGMQELNRSSRRVITYFHPWEIDPDQPRVKNASWLSRFRHYYDLEGTESKLRRLLCDFRFGSIRDVFWSEKTARYEITPQQ